jgi:hypothetical protein
VVPFNIVKAGIYKKELMYGRYIPIPVPYIAQKDSSNKTSYIRIRFDDKYLVNKIIFDVEGAKYFKRKFYLFDENNENDLLLESYLSSETGNEFIIDCKSNQFFLTINNEDNIPLKMKAVQALQLNTYLLTYLDAGENYSLNFGDSTVPAPKYDLDFFSDSANNNSSEISVKSFEKTKLPETLNKTSSKGNTLFLWVVISAVLVILCFFTFRMIEEVQKKHDKVSDNIKK